MSEEKSEVKRLPEYDKEQLRSLLEDGVGSWNQWREDNPDVKVVLCGADLSRTHLKGVDLNEANLHGANLRGAELANACFWNADLSTAILHKAALQDANLMLSDLTGAILSEANLSNAMLNLAKLTKADLTKAILSNADVRFADFSRADIWSVRISRKTLCGSADFDTCKGDPVLKRQLQDKAYLENFKQRHPKTYWLWFVSCDCGRSMWPWILWGVAFILVFAAVFCCFGRGGFKVNELNPDSFFTFLYYSVVTFTTLGFGDVVPKTSWAAFWVMLEVILGYIMLGGLVSILGNKMARRS